MIKYFQDFRSDLENFFMKGYHPLILLHINTNNNYSESIFIEKLIR